MKWSEIHNIINFRNKKYENIVWLVEKEISILWKGEKSIKQKFKVKVKTNKYPFEKEKKLNKQISEK